MSLNTALIALFGCLFPLTVLSGQTNQTEASPSPDKTVATASSQHKLHWKNRAEPYNWKVVSRTRRDDMWIMELAPENADKEDHSNLLIVQAFIKPENFSLEQWSASIILTYQQKCNAIKVDALKNDGAIGYDQRSLFIMCGRKLDEEFGVYTFLKGIRKDRLFYVILREIQVPPSEIAGALTVPKGSDPEEVFSGTADAMRYLFEDVYLCGPDIINPQCQ